MSVPRKRRGRPAFRALITAIPEPLKVELVAAAADDDRSQREIIERALEEYLARRRSVPKPPAP